MLEPGRPSLFVVDRDPHVCKLMRQFLAEDWAVECFADGYTALDRIRRVPPSILVTEILVPELDGLALCRLLKEDAATRAVPILVLSMVAARVRATAAGADAFLDKPVERIQLLAALRGISAATGHGAAQSPREQAAP
jgi:DNA-binding response OmpR family regulator